MKHLIYHLLIIGTLCIAVPVNTATASKGLNINSSQTTGMGAKRKQPSQTVKLPPKFPQKHPRRINWTDKLDLSKDQAAQVQQIYDSSQPEIDTLILQIRQLHKRIAEIYRQDDTKIKEILDEQQKIKFEKEQRKMQKRKGIKPEAPKPSRKRMPQF